MISISTTTGELIRTLPSVNMPILFGWHKTFGFISASSAIARAANRKKFGLAPHESDWLCQFFIKPSNEEKINTEFQIQPVFGCTAAENSVGKTITFADQIFQFQSTIAKSPNIFLHSESKEDKKTITLILLVLLAALFLVYLNMSGVENIEKEITPEPVTVTIAKPERVVRLPTSAVADNIRIRTKEAEKNRIIQKQVKEKLGFLDLVGNKNLSKIAGGTPTNLKEVSPGAGAGGKEGSGGEMLVGLGQGVKATTVGNSGVSGLGGIGTKGRGGGEGGYGRITVSSGSSGGISKGAIGQDMMIEGGLSQAAIQATIAKYISQVRACYEEGLRKNSGLTGLVTAKFLIGVDGNVDSVQTANSSLNNQEVETCIERRATTWKFPKPLGSVKVRFSYPFLLKPVQS